MTKTSSTARAERALIKAVLDAPDDPGPLQVYADWLTERGQEGDARRAYACRWMAARGKRPEHHRYPDKPPHLWTWYLEASHWTVRRRMDWRHWTDAVDWLGEHLAALLAVALVDPKESP